MVEFTRRKLMETSVAAALGASVVDVASADVDESDTDGAPSVKGELKRFSTTSFGAEVTGPFVFADGSLLHSLQHPITGKRGDGFDKPNAKANQPPYDRAGVGYFRDFTFDLDGNNDDFDEAPIPKNVAQQGRVLSANHRFEMLIQAREPINGGEERLGVTETPDGTEITRDDFSGTQYGAVATNPDCNQFVPTNEAGTEGYLFTNWENSPGNVTRVKISQDDKGDWEADLDDAINLANTDELRNLGGTRINCYGDLSPWGTMISSEENYAHPRVAFTNTVSDIVDAEEGGEGLTGAAQFWNRPNPTEVGSSEWFNEFNDGTYPQGAFALSGVEFLAYYLGSEQTDTSDPNDLTPIGDVYPNPYDYGYHVDFRKPEADPPEPVKYYVMGRASWEAPDIMSDRKTVYGCSDGDSKGIYKFVADEPIDSYDDTDDIEGTLYAPKITNDAASADDAGQRNSPADTPLEVEWLELGTASNGEVASWIVQYDEVTQVDYLEAHTDWSEGEEVTEELLAAADRYVVENGNPNYITNQEIVEWATQYEQRGPDGVDEELRKVPFLETRAAAKEIGASIEFNKAEGVDSVDGAESGDYVYFGISEFNDGLANDEGDIQLDRVDGGVVYRAELEEDYNVSTLEPVIVGPDFTDEPSDQDDALKNIDNVYAMDDGRVLCCEDGFADGNRSYPNDGLYVYKPDENTGEEDDSPGKSPADSPGNGREDNPGGGN